MKKLQIEIHKLPLKLQVELICVFLMRIIECLFLLFTSETQENKTV